MADNQSTKKKEKDLSSASIAQTGIDTVHSEIKKQVQGRLGRGDNPKNILSELLQSVGTGPSQQDVLKNVLNLAETQVGTGEKQGLLSGLLRGQGTSRPEITEDLGVENAIKVQNLQRQQSEFQSKLPQRKTDLIKALLDVAKQTGDRELFRSLGGKDVGEVVERDPLTGDPTLKGIQDRAAAQAIGTEKAKKDIKLEDLRRDLDVYFNIAELIPTGEGFKRFNTGLKSLLLSLEQGDPRGVATERLNAMNKRLRVTLVRAAGDVGNLNIVEQKAAEQLLFSPLDSTKTRQLKGAVLRDLTRSIKERNSVAVKSLIQEWQKTPEFKEIQQGKSNKPSDSDEEDFTKLTDEELIAIRDGE